MDGLAGIWKIALRAPAGNVTSLSILIKNGESVESAEEVIRVGVHLALPIAFPGQSSTKKAEGLAGVWRVEMTRFDGAAIDGTVSFAKADEALPIEGIEERFLNALSRLLVAAAAKEPA